jgi:hypothetical protein
MNKIFGAKQLNNVGFTSGGSQNTGGLSASATDVLVLNNLKKLMTSIDLELKEYIGYLTGNVTIPQNSISINNIALTIFNLKQRTLNATLYEKYRSFVSSVIISYQNINSYVVYNQNLKSQLDSALEKASILDNLTLLKEYIEKKNKSFNILPNQEITITKALIKEPYNTYILTFGVPTNMVWDLDRLEYITDLLKTTTTG